MVRARAIATNIGLITLAPFFIANFAPVKPPNIIEMTKGIPNKKSTLPFNPNVINDAAQLVKLSILPFPALMG